jgi:hypothetical protein
MNPLVDPGYTTALNVNRCIREMLVGLALRKQGITTPNYLDPRAAGEPGGRRGPARRGP